MVLISDVNKVLEVIQYLSSSEPAICWLGKGKFRHELHLEHCLSAILSFLPKCYHPVQHSIPSQCCFDVFLHYLLLQVSSSGWWCNLDGSICASMVCCSGDGKLEVYHLQGYEGSHCLIKLGEVSIRCGVMMRQWTPPPFGAMVVWKATKRERRILGIQGQTHKRRSDFCGRNF